MKPFKEKRFFYLVEGWNILKAWLSAVTGNTFSRPITVNLLPSLKCNSRCLMCDAWRMPDKEPLLRLDDYARLAAEMKSLGIPFVTIGGGEPFLNSDIFSIIREFSQMGISVQVTTNGYELNGDLCKKLADAGLKRLTFSIDTHLKEHYRKLRGVDWFDRVVGNIRETVTKYSGIFNVETNSVLSKDNIADFDETARFFLKLGVSKVCFSAVTVTDKNNLIMECKGGLEGLTKELLDAAVEKLLKLKKEYPKRIAASRAFIRGLRDYMLYGGKAVYPCYAGFLSMDILPGGDVYACGNLPPFGNVRQNRLGDIWYSKEALRARLLMAGKNCPACYTSCKIELALLADPIHGISYVIEKVRELL